MKNHFKKTLIASTIALSMTGLGASTAALAGASKDSLGENISEARLETQIWTTYALNSQLAAMQLGVKVDDDKAILSGTVKEAVSRDLAEQIALGVEGIQRVDNQITVKPDYEPEASATDKRSYGEVVDDLTITSRVKSKLLWNSHTDGLQINVDTQLGKVTLQGSADTEVQKELAGELAANTRGVVSVDNQLKIGQLRDKVKAGLNKAEAKTSSVADAAGTEISDSWITAKVKTTFLYTANVDGTDITVATKDGVVTLSGQADSQQEYELAVKLAGSIRGVKSVVATNLKS